MNGAPSTALVTGATGFIGARLISRLRALGVPTVCLVRAASAGRRFLESSPGVEVLEVATSSSAELERAIGDRQFDAVFHLAAAGVRPDERDPDALIEGNVSLTARLIAALAKKPPRRFVFAGTCSEYAPAEDGVLIDEAHPIGPTSSYGAAKAAAFLCGKALAVERGVPFVSLRLFGVFGPGEGPMRLIPHLLACLGSGGTPSLSPGNQARDFTYIDDVVDALLAGATSASIEPFHVYNVCSGRATRVRDVALAVARAVGRQDADIGLGRKPHRPDEPLWIVGNPHRFERATGWAPRVTLEQGIATMAELAAGRSG